MRPQIVVEEHALWDLESLGSATRLADWMFDQFSGAAKGAVVEVGAGQYEDGVDGRCLHPALQAPQALFRLGPREKLHQNNPRLRIVSSRGHATCQPQAVVPRISSRAIAPDRFRRRLAGCSG